MSPLSVSDIAGQAPPITTIAEPDTLALLGLGLLGLGVMRRRRVVKRPLLHQERKLFETARTSVYSHKRTFAGRWCHQPLREVVRHGASLWHARFAGTVNLHCEVTLIRKG